jgi:RNA polymerase sigma factor (sigma-70 family)
MSIPPDKSFLALIEENKRIIFKICNSYCPNKDERDDLAQEMVYNLWKSYQSFNTNLKFSTWMYRIALNVAISFYRKEKKSAPHVSISDHLIILEENTSTEMDNNLNLLLKFINELREIDKSIMLLYLDDKSYKEIAEITGISESNVATKISRIKEKLKSNFQTIQNNQSWN